MDVSCFLFTYSCKPLPEAEIRVFPESRLQRLRRGILRGRSARRTDSKCRIEIPLEIFRSMLPNHRHMRVKLDLAGGFKAGKMTAVADVARPGRIAMFMTRQDRNGNHHQHGESGQERGEWPEGHRRRNNPIVI